MWDFPHGVHWASLSKKEPEWRSFWCPNTDSSELFLGRVQKCRQWKTAWINFLFSSDHLLIKVRIQKSTWWFWKRRIELVHGNYFWWSLVLGKVVFSEKPEFILNVFLKFALGSRLFLDLSNSNVSVLLQLLFWDFEGGWSHQLEIGPFVLVNLHL